MACGEGLLAALSKAGIPDDFSSRSADIDPFLSTMNVIFT
jgi:hypothetical protein